MSTAIQQDAAQKLTLGMEWSEDDAAEELLKRFLPDDQDGADAEKPSAEKGKAKKSAEPKDEDEDETSAEKPGDEAEDEDEGDEAQDADEGDEDGEEKQYAADGAYIKIKVGEEEHEVPVAKLSRLWGQEAALTKKSTEVAELRKHAEAETQKNVATTQALLARARSRLEPYKQVDFNLLAAHVGREGGISAEDYQSLRQGAQAAYEDVQFLEQHLDGFMGAIAEKAQADLRTKAKEAIEVLKGPVEKGGIEGWNQKLYDEIRAYAVEQGAPAEVINQVVDPWAIRMMHNAMLFARGRAKTSEVKTEKVVKKPKRIVKTSNSPEAARSESKSSAESKAMRKLRESGSQDDAAEAMLARWRKDSDD